MVSSILYTVAPNQHTISLYTFLVDLITVGLVLSISVFLYVTALLMTKNTGNLTIIGFTGVIVGYGISLVRYGEPPNIIGILGSVGILVGLICILYKGSSLNKT